jgi:hypothetical protein
MVDCRIYKFENVIITIPLNYLGNFKTYVRNMSGIERPSLQ